MFKHSKKEYDTEHDPEHDETDCIIDAVETISLSGVNEEDLVDEDEMDVNEKTFLFKYVTKLVNNPLNVKSVTLQQKEELT